MLSSFYKIVVFSLSVVFFISCENDFKTKKKVVKTPDVSQEIGMKIMGYMSTGGKIQATLKAPYMTRSASDSEVTEFPKKLEVLLYNDTGKVDTHINADYGRYVKRSNIITLKGNVRIRTANKDTLKTSLLYFDQNQNTIYTSKPVWFHRINPMEELVYAKKGLWANSKDMRNYTFYDARPISFLEYSEMALNTP